jgi:hypothetical protein
MVDTRLALPPERQGFAEKLAILAGKALETANTWAIGGVRDAEQIGETLRQWGQIVKGIKDEKDIDCKPLRAEAKRRGARWDAAAKPLEQAIGIGKAIMDAWRVASQERALAALPAAPAEERRAAVEVLVAKPMQVRRYYSARVVNEAALARRYWIIDQQALDARARAEKETFSEPGCELVVEERSTLG